MGDVQDPVSYTTSLWEELSIDFVIDLLNSEGKNSIMVMVDQLMGYAHFFSLSHSFMVSTISITFTVIV
jgi:hypothetical protein